MVLCDCWQNEETKSIVRNDDEVYPVTLFILKDSSTQFNLIAFGCSTLIMEFHF